MKSKLLIPIAVLAGLVSAGAGFPFGEALHPVAEARVVNSAEDVLVRDDARELNASGVEDGAVEDRGVESSRLEEGESGVAGSVGPEYADEALDFDDARWRVSLAHCRPFNPYVHRWCAAVVRKSYDSTRLACCEIDDGHPGPLFEASALDGLLEGATAGGESGIEATLVFLGAGYRRLIVNAPLRLSRGHVGEAIAPGFDERGVGSAVAPDCAYDGDAGGYELAVRSPLCGPGRATWAPTFLRKWKFYIMGNALFIVLAGSFWFLPRAVDRMGNNPYRVGVFVSFWFQMWLLLAVVFVVYRSISHGIPSCQDPSYAPCVGVSRSEL